MLVVSQSWVRRHIGELPAVLRQFQGTSGTGNREAGGGTCPTQEKFTIAEFADQLGFPVAALNAIITKNRAAVKRPFYNISQLADRWGCSRAQVYNILREAEFKVLNTASRSSEERQSWRIPASVVEKIEQSRMERLPEAAA